MAGLYDWLGGGGGSTLVPRTALAKAAQGIFPTPPVPTPTTALGKAGQGIFRPPQPPEPEHGPYSPFPPETGPLPPKFPPPGTPPTTPATRWTRTGNYENDILGFLRQYYPGATPADLESAMPELQAMYPGLTPVGKGKIRLPDGRVIDIGLAFGAGGGRGWWWGEDSGGGGGDTSGATGGSQFQQGGFGLPGGAFDLGPATFDDPETAKLLDFIQQRIGQLTQPQQDPALQAYLDAAAGFAKELSTPFVNPNAAQIDALMQQLLTDVTGAPFSDQQSAALRAQAYDQLEQDRAASLRRETARLGQLGHGAASGTIAQSLGDVNRSYDALRGQQGRALTIAGIDQANKNRAQAIDLGGQIRQQPLLDQAAQETRQAQGMAALQAVTQALAGQRAENEARLDRALALTSLPVQLGDQRLQQALQVLGMGGGSDPSSIFNALTQVAQLTQTSNLAQQQQNNQFWTSLFQSMAGTDWSKFGRRSTTAAT